MLFANNNDADQTALMCSLISVFVVCYMSSMVTKILKDKLGSVYSQASLSPIWSQTALSEFLVARFIIITHIMTSKVSIICPLLD